MLLLMKDGSSSLQWGEIDALVCFLISLVLSGLNIVSDVAADKNFQHESVSVNIHSRIHMHALVSYL